MITSIRIPIINCTEGIYLRWWYNGFHYFLFRNGYEIQMKTESMDTQVTKMFSIISKIERPTKLKTDYSYHVTLEGITEGDIPGFTGLLQAEKVEQYEEGLWYEVDITRGDHIIKDENAPGYILDFEITRKELSNTSAVFQKSQYLYIGDTLCDMDDDEVIPINKQTNDIAEMQDRQSDFTAQFKIRKTRAMRALFELSGEVGANTTFPYENKTAKLIQDGIEIITGGNVILDSVDDQYYYISVLSGNSSFFKEIEGKKITELALATTNHTWNAETQAASNASNLDYIYPLMEPSNDGGMSPLTDTGTRVNLYGGWIWPFIRLKAIWDEIFSNAQFTYQGPILAENRFLNLFMPITTINIAKDQIDKYLYSLWHGYYYRQTGQPLPGGTVINGDAAFAGGLYTAPFTATYKFKIETTLIIPQPPSRVYLYSTHAGTGIDFIINAGLSFQNKSVWELELPTVAGDVIGFYMDLPSNALNYTISVVEIKDSQIGYSSVVAVKNHLADISQTEFIKMVCNMFGLIPDAKPRDKKIRFWTYTDLYDNIAIARDWSAYLSERDDEVEFKFGDYAQSNYLKYKDSDDVIEDNGKGTMLIEDNTLPVEKDVVLSPLSTCDEVIIMTDISVSRIAFNKWDQKTSAYIQNESIDPRIVYVKQVTGKTFGVRTQVSGGSVYDVADPKIACSLEVSFSNLVVNYAGLSRMLTKTNLRKAKFNLPVYEVAQLRHDIPIYLSQYKAYFYVNKINNYVPGKLCIIDLIKL